MGVRFPSPALLDDAVHPSGGLRFRRPPADHVGMEAHVASLHAAVDTLLELVDRYGELVDAAHANGLHPALLAGIADAEARADLPGLRAALGVTAA
jgi:hypothetical protein